MHVYVYVYIYICIYIYIHIHSILVYVYIYICDIAYVIYDIVYLATHTHMTMNGFLSSLKMWMQVCQEVFLHVLGFFNVFHMGPTYECPGQRMVIHSNLSEEAHRFGSAASLLVAKVLPPDITDKTCEGHADLPTKHWTTRRFPKMGVLPNPIQQDFQWQFLDL